MRPLGTQCSQLKRPVGQMQMWLDSCRSRTTSAGLYAASIADDDREALGQRGAGVSNGEQHPVGMGLSVPKA